MIPPESEHIPPYRCSSEMFAVLDPAIIAIVVALIAPLATYLVAAKRLSGRIRDSEATDLWAESRSIRDWSTTRMKELSDEIRELEQRLNELVQENADLKRRLGEGDV